MSSYKKKKLPAAYVVEDVEDDELDSFQEFLPDSSSSVTSKRGSGG